MRTRSSTLPFVFINMAMTADGKIATANRAVSTFGSEKDKAHLLELRSRSDAVMAGARTVDLNPTTLGPGGMRYRRKRLDQGLAEYNIRIVVTGSGSLDPSAEIFRHRHSPIIILTSEKAPKRSLQNLRKLTDHVFVSGKNSVDFTKAFAWLKKEFGVEKLLCEGGGKLNSALFQANLIHEVHLTICPFIFGGSNAPTISDGRGVLHLKDATQLELQSIRRAGPELFAVYNVRSASPRR